MLFNSKAQANLARNYLGRAGVDLSQVEFIVHPTNRGWTRDSGPIFVRSRKSEVRRQGSATAIVHFHFNAWAKYDDWQKDRRVPETAAHLLGKRLFNAQCKGKDFVIEGGGIEVNGRGSLLTTAECYLDPKVQVRNPGLRQPEIEETLRKYLGVRISFGWPEDRSATIPTGILMIFAGL